MARKIAPKLEKLIAIVARSVNFELEAFYEKQSVWTWCINFYWQIQEQPCYYNYITHEVLLCDSRLESIADVICWEIREISHKQKPIGDTTCKFNARSPLIRCAINPSGPCEGCGYYEV
ncbi:hypothetical protein GS682_04870 [Nostoc sp. B(2019)]|nr:hypothetical protein [Nostoc sp. B(2019)]